MARSRTLGRTEGVASTRSNRRSSARKLQPIWEHPIWIIHGHPIQRTGPKAATQTTRWPVLIRCTSTPIYMQVQTAALLTRASATRNRRAGTSLWIEPGIEVGCQRAGRRVTASRSLRQMARCTIDTCPIHIPGHSWHMSPSSHCPATAQPLSSLCPASVQPLSSHCPASVQPLPSLCPASSQPLPSLCPAPAQPLPSLLIL